MAGLFDEPSVKYARVAVERGVDQFPDGLTYGVPERLLPLSVGQLVTVLLAEATRQQALGFYPLPMMHQNLQKEKKQNKFTKKTATPSYYPRMLLNLPNG